MQLKVSFAAARWCKWKWQQGITTPIIKIAQIKKVLQLDEFWVNVSSSLMLFFSALAIVLSLTNFPFADLEHKLLISLSNNLNFLPYIHEKYAWILAYISLVDWRDYCFFLSFRFIWGTKSIIKSKYRWHLCKSYMSEHVAPCRVNKRQKGILQYDLLSLKTSTSE